MPHMAEPESRATIRAAVEAIAPSTDQQDGAAAIGVEDHVVALADQYLPGFADVIAALCNAYAYEHAGEPFASLDLAARRQALRAMVAEESVDVRDAADALFAFTWGGLCSEWSGYDRERGRLTPPASWAVMGFHGPSIGHPDFGAPPSGPAHARLPEPPA